MTRTHAWWMTALLLLGSAFAQDQGNGAAPAATPAAALQMPKKPQLSEAARTAMATAKELAAKVRGLTGDAQLAALMTAAQAYDRTATDLANEPIAAAQASFAAGDLWRRHGSFGESERSYLLASKLDAERYAQRGLLAAADMQRRAERYEEAMRTYKAAADVDPTTARAQVARLWQARVLQSLQRPVDAVVAFRSALASAATPRQVVTASNELARALVLGGDLEGAQQVLDRADAAISSAIAEIPEDAESLHKALESMSSRRLLQRARDKVTNASGDAQQLENAQKGS